MLKKLLACCLSLMLVLGCVTPAAVAEDPSTPTDLCQHLNTYTVQCSENPGNYEPYNSKQHADCIYYYNEILTRMEIIFPIWKWSIRSPMDIFRLSIR